MNFWMLKSMVENLVASYSCPFCNSKEIWEKHIDIVGAAGNTVNIDVQCPSCNKHFIAKTEVFHMDASSIDAKKLEKLQQALSAMKGKLGGDIEIELDIGGLDMQTLENINDENITKLQKDMKEKDFSLDDLFAWEE